MLFRSRKDGKNMIEQFQAQGYQYVSTPDELEKSNASKLLGLFASEDMDYEIDRNPKETPSLVEMLRSGLKTLNRTNSKDKAKTKNSGFVLFAENENTDTAGHRNDVAALMKEMWSFDEAVQVALNFQKKHPDTLLIVTGDHETGGFSPTYGRKNSGPAGKQNYLNVSNDQLRQLASYKMSLDEFSNQYKEQVKIGRAHV